MEQSRNLQALQGLYGWELCSKRKTAARHTSAMLLAAAFFHWVVNQAAAFDLLDLAATRRRTRAVNGTTFNSPA
jgi:hypothetical protein